MTMKAFRRINTMSSLVSSLFLASRLGSTSKSLSTVLVTPNMRSSEPTGNAASLSEGKGSNSGPFSAIQSHPPPLMTNFNLGGPHGNETYLSFLQRSGKEGSVQDWEEWLSGVNATHHPKEDVLKLILMTRNEWPLLREWVYYHGAMLGFHNLHIFDGSTDLRCIEFLKEARKRYGLNVVFTQTDLNGLSELITDTAKQLASDADFIAKVDTDEFLGALEGGCNKESSDCELSPWTVTDRLQERQLVPYGDGRKFCFGYTMNSVPVRELCESGSAETQQLRFSGLARNCGYKALLDARTMRKIDLGGHAGASLPPFSDTEVLVSNLGIFHLHNRCIESEVASSRQACIRHGYMNEDDTKSQVLEKFKTYYDGDFCQVRIGRGGMFCSMASCHKVSFYGSYLACPNETTDDFYRLGENPSFGPNEKFASYLKAALENYAFD